jgi:ubiquinone/menaquinone biosynthesis C-methylase UbiE
MVNKQDINKRGVADFYDRGAPVYDDKLHSGFISSLVRGHLLKKLLESFPPGSHLLDIGCGTGDDAVYLAQRGIKITGIDISSQMLVIAEKKVSESGLKKMINLQLLDAENISSLNNSLFDGAYSDFNALNHLESLGNFSEGLAKILKPRSKFFAVMLGRLSVSEVSSYMLMLRPLAAFQKLIHRDKSFPFYIKLYYPSSVKKIFSLDFILTGLSGYGLLVPPDQFYNKRFLKLFPQAAKLESAFTRRWPFYNFCDHYLIEFEKHS